MSDLISRQDAIDALNELNCFGYVEEAFEQLAEKIMSVPSAQQKGKWKKEVLGSTSGYGTTVMYQCSECEQMAISKYKFCPNCGADMRKGDEE